MTQDQQLPITTLILSRSKELGLSRTQLVRRSGYTNTAKGLRRLDELLEGQFQSTRGLIRALPLALEVSANVVEQAVEDTKRLIRDAEEAAWRSAFVPHAVILTERRIPQPIHVAAILGVNRLLRVEFDLTAGEDSFLEQAIKGIGQKLDWTRRIPAFGKPTGIVVNYTPDHAVEFDLQGKPVMTYDHAYRPGKASLSIRRRPMSEREMAAIFQPV